MKTLTTPSGTTVRFGRTRPIAVGPHFKLRHYLRGVPSAPPSCDYSAKAASVLSDVYQNDTLGCCVVSGYYHTKGVETGNATGTPFHATSTEIISDYSAIGGYVPGDSSTDQGCDEVTAMNFWSQHGDVSGTRLAGWLAVDATNKSEVQAACYLFENLYFGLELPDTYTNPFPSGNGFTWDIGTPDPEQGHCIVGVGYDTTGVQIATWGLLGTMTWAAVAQLCVQATGGALYVLLTPDQVVSAAAKAPNGVAWLDLLADFNAMGGSVPIPAPSPAPTPSGPVQLSDAQSWASAALQAAFPLLTRAQAIAAANAGLAAHWPSS